MASTTHPARRPTMKDMVPFNGLRGVCALAIFLGHQTELFLDWNPGLEFLQAISLFFLLSGIPLVRLYSSKMDSWREVKDFWRKRFARLFPIYYLTLVANFSIVLFLCKAPDVSATLKSLLGCAFFLQSWFVSLITVGGVLWQVAVFLYGYACFPFLSRRIQNWTNSSLLLGMLLLWLLSAGFWIAVFAKPVEEREMSWWIWHVHCVSRLPHIFAGVLLGQLIERKRRSIPEGDNGSAAVAAAADALVWSRITDTLSLVLVLTAIQAPIVQYLSGSSLRSEVSIGLQALLLPLHATWLAGMVLAYHPEPEPGAEARAVVCWTRRVLSFRPLVALGDVSLVLYCLHLVVLFYYTAAWTMIQTGDWHVVLSDYSLTARQLSWWHAPIQWLLVVAASFGVSRWFEAPARKLLAGTSRQMRVVEAAETDSESAKLLPPETDGPAQYTASQGR